MDTLSPTTVGIRSPEELTRARNLVFAWAKTLAFSLVERTKFVTAASELGRNVLVHGRGGTMTIRKVTEGGRDGLQLKFQDQGVGIADVDRALSDGFSTANTMGIGLGGARRLVNDFVLATEPGKGTTVVVTQWKRR